MLSTQALMRGKFDNSIVNRVDHFMGSGGSCSDTDVVHSVKPGFLQLTLALDMVGRNLLLLAYLQQLSGVRGVVSSHHNHHSIAAGEFICELLHRTLPVLGRLADGIHKLDLHLRKSVANLFKQFTGVTNPVRCLAHDPDPLTGGELVDVIFAANDRKLFEITDDSSDLDMVPLAEDDRVPAFVHQPSDSSVNPQNQRAGSIEDVVAPGLEFCLDAPGRAVGGDHDIVGGDLVFEGIHHLNAVVLQFLDRLGIVNQLTDDGQITRE